MFGVGVAGIVQFMQIVIAVLLLAGNAFFVAVEFAVTRRDRRWSVSWRPAVSAARGRCSTQ
ncbi:MAG: hypothetical protein ACRDUV_02075 [Pseudonocardiaceae bacterium]